ncbi:MAG TPA: glycosyltransferase family 87 protein [Terriglobales bacterium]
MLKNSKLGIAIAALLAFSMWFYVQQILIPYQKRDAAAHNQPRGILSDLYPRWLGARELLLRGHDPYSTEVTHEIQQGYYGRELDPERPEDPKDEQRFAYPVYVVFLLAPTVRLPFEIVRPGFTIFLVLLTAASVWFWFKALGWRTSLSGILIAIVLTLGSLPVAQGIKLQQLSLLAAGLLSACAAAVAGGYLAIGGVLLALATIKPQLAWLPAAWLLLWVIRDWPARQRFFWGFAGTMAALLLGAQWILPGWTGEFVNGIRAYHRYTQNISVLGLLLTPFIGHLVSILLVAATFCSSWPRLKQNATDPGFGVALAVLIALDVLIAPMFAPYNQVLLLPAILVLARASRALWREDLVIRSLSVLTVVSVAWPWMAALGLMLAMFFEVAERVQDAWRVPFYTTFIIPILVFTFNAAFAVRASRSQRLH